MIQILFDNMQTLIISLGGIAGLSAFFKELYRLYMRKQEYSMAKVMAKEGAIYAHLSQIQHDTGADKVVMLKLHNGGGEVRVGHPVYVSVTHETHTRTIPDQIKKWKGVRLDPSYISVIQGLLASPNKRLKVEKENIAEGVMQDAMERYKINHVWHFHVFTHRPKPFRFLPNLKEERVSNMWYLSIVFLEDNPQDTIHARERDSVREHVQAIRNLLEQSKRYD